MLRIKKAEITDCCKLAKDLRPVEVEEVLLTGAKSAYDAAYNSVCDCEINFTIMNDDKVISMSGCRKVDVIADFGCIWLLTTKHIYDVNFFRYCRVAKILTGIMKNYCGRLCNYSLAKHTEATRFFEFLKCKITYNAKTINGEKFHFIEL